MIGMDTRFRMQVPIASKRRNRPVSSLKMTADMVDQKNALRPKAAKGNAVAVPRCVGKFDAAVLIDAEKAEELPKPVRNAKNDSSPTLKDPCPCSYAEYIG